MLSGIIRQRGAINWRILWLAQRPTISAKAETTAYSASTEQLRIRSVRSADFHSVVGTRSVKPTLVVCKRGRDQHSHNHNCDKRSIRGSLFVHGHLSAPFCQNLLVGHAPLRRKLTERAAAWILNGRAGHASK
jgi:hypothetical protein